MRGFCQPRVRQCLATYHNHSINLCRARMREEVASMPDGEDVEWSDADEREFRRRYVEMR